jgi:hypothetical protein
MLKEKPERLNTAGYQTFVYINQAAQCVDERIRKLKDEMTQMAVSFSGETPTAREMAVDTSQVRDQVH